MTPIMNLEPLLILDGDDTLWEMQSIYDEAKDLFKRRMVEIGLPTIGVIELLDSIDAKNVQALGFTRHRFPKSLVQTYRILCQESGRSIDPIVEDEVREIGMQVFGKLPTLHPETKQVLRSLRRQFRLVLLTKGDLRIQEEKIRKLGLEALFDKIYIVPDKTQDEYRRVLQDFQVEPDNVFVVGDSLRSDIAPAVGLGIRSFWIPRRSWNYERGEVPEGVAVIRDLNELATALLKAGAAGNVVKRP